MDTEQGAGCSQLSRFKQPRPRQHGWECLRWALGVGVCYVCHHEFDVAPVGWFWVLGWIGRSQAAELTKMPPGVQEWHPKIDLLFPRPGSGPGWLAGRKKADRLCGGPSWFPGYERNAT